MKSWEQLETLRDRREQKGPWKRTHWLWLLSQLRHPILVKCL